MSAGRVSGLVNRERSQTYLRAYRQTAGIIHPFPSESTRIFEKDFRRESSACARPTAITASRFLTKDHSKAMSDGAARGAPSLMSSVLDGQSIFSRGRPAWF